MDPDTHRLILKGTEAGYRLSVPATLPVPILIAVPHAGRAYSPHLLDAMRDPACGPLRLEDRFADTLAEAVAAATGAALLIADTPRAMIDLNRAPDDVDWTMIADGVNRRVPHSMLNRRARGGLGLIPRRLSGYGEIWKQRLPLVEMEARIADVHRPYHRQIGEVLDLLRDRWGAALLIDFHSMPPLDPSGQAGTGAEFVIGDRFGASCAPHLSAHALHSLTRAGRIAAHNRPYSGGYTLDHHAARRREIHALQIEVCRASYLDARLDRPGPRLPAVARVIAGMVRTLAREVAALGYPASERQAAE